MNIDHWDFEKSTAHFLHIDHVGHYSGRNGLFILGWMGLLFAAS